MKCKKLLSVLLTMSMVGAPILSSNCFAWKVNDNTYICTPSNVNMFLNSLNEILVNKQDEEGAAIIEGHIKDLKFYVGKNDDDSIKNFLKAYNIEFEKDEELEIFKNCFKKYKFNLPEDKKEDKKVITEEESSTEKSSKIENKSSNASDSDTSEDSVDPKEIKEYPQDLIITPNENLNTNDLSTKKESHYFSKRGLALATLAIAAPAAYVGYKHYNSGNNICNFEDVNYGTCSFDDIATCSIDDKPGFINSAKNYVGDTFSNIGNSVKNLWNKPKADKAAVEDDDVNAKAIVEYNNDVDNNKPNAIVEYVKGLSTSTKTTAGAVLGLVAGVGLSFVPGLQGLGFAFAATSATALTGAGAAAGYASDRYLSNNSTNATTSFNQTSNAN